MRFKLMGATACLALAIGCAEQPETEQEGLPTVQASESSLMGTVSTPGCTGALEFQDALDIGRLVASTPEFRACVDEAFADPTYSACPGDPWASNGLASQREQMLAVARSKNSVTFACDGSNAAPSPTSVYAWGHGNTESIDVGSGWYGPLFANWDTLYCSGGSGNCIPANQLDARATVMSEVWAAAVMTHGYAASCNTSQVTAVDIIEGCMAQIYKQIRLVSGGTRCTIGAWPGGQSQVEGLLWPGINGALDCRHKPTFRSGDHRWTAGDFSGSGRTDLLRNAGDQGVEVLFSDDMPDIGRWFNLLSFNPHVQLKGYEWVVADFNNDERDDLLNPAFAWGGIEIYFSETANFISFSAAHVPSQTAHVLQGHNWEVGDFDCDGNRDLIAKQTLSAGARVFYGDGAGNFPENKAYLSNEPTHGWAWKVGDFDADGCEDDIFRQMNQYGGVEMYFRNPDYDRTDPSDPDPPFIYQGRWNSAGHWGHGWYVDDFDGDGFRDDVMRLASASGGAQFWTGNGETGVAGTAFNYWGVLNGYGIWGDRWVTADFDGDGQADLLRKQFQDGGLDIFKFSNPGGSSPYFRRWK